MTPSKRDEFLGPLKPSWANSRLGRRARGALAAAAVVTLSVGVLIAPMLLVVRPHPGGLLPSQSFIRAQRAATVSGLEKMGYERLPPVRVEGATNPSGEEG